jgi:asparagine synthase (glutamine-hydrolysing)
MRIALAHCRLAINDLSPTGSQPLHSPNRSIHAIINGELYYPPSLPASLDYKFTGTSDSELAIALYQTYGLSFLSHLRGEFALILYDEDRDLVIVARDRYGIKPLFWRRSEKGRVEFSAEVKGFMGLGWEGEWDISALVSGGWGQDTRTMFKGIHKVSQYESSCCNSR